MQPLSNARSEETMVGSNSDERFAMRATSLATQRMNQSVFDIHQRPGEYSLV